MFSTALLSTSLTLIVLLIHQVPGSEAQCTLNNTFNTLQDGFFYHEESGLANFKCVSYKFQPTTKNSNMTLSFKNTACKRSEIWVYNEKGRLLRFGESTPVTISFTTQADYLIIEFQIRRNGLVFATVSFDSDRKPVTTTTTSSSTTTTRTTSTSSSPTTTYPPVQLPTECGKSKIEPSTVSSKIIGGSIAKANSWPWQVFLRGLSGWYCGGSIIDNSWIVTAAHCLYGETNQTVQVYLGYQNRRNLTANYSLPAKIINHEMYNPKTSQNDIALIKLSKPVSFSNVVQPICLPASNLASYYSSAIVTGWGSTDIRGEEPSDYPNELHQVAIPVMSQRVCRDIFTYYNTSTQICAGNPSSVVSEIRDSCFGDSGGPLKVKSDQDGRYNLIGVVSYGADICDGFGVYTNVYSYVNWIKNKIASNN